MGMAQEKEGKAGEIIGKAEKSREKYGKTEKIKGNTSKS